MTDRRTCMMCEFSIPSPARWVVNCGLLGELRNDLAEECKFMKLLRQQRERAEKAESRVAELEGSLRYLLGVIEADNTRLSGGEVAEYVTRAMGEAARVLGSGTQGGER